MSRSMIYALLLAAVIAVWLSFTALQKRVDSRNSAVPAGKWQFIRGLIYKDKAAIDRVEKELLALPDGEEKIRALYEFYCSNNLRKRSIEMLLVALRETPDNWHYTLMIAEAYIGLKEYGEAEKYLKKAEVMSYKNDPWRNSFVARTYALFYLAQKKYDKVPGCLEKSLQLLGDGDTVEEAYVYGTYSNLYFELKDYAKAKEYARKAQSLYPEEHNFRKLIEDIDRAGGQ